VVGAVLEVPVHGLVEAADLLGCQGVLDAQITLHLEVPHHVIELRIAEETGHRVSRRGSGRVRSPGTQAIFPSKRVKPDRLGLARWADRLLGPIRTTEVPLPVPVVMIDRAHENAAREAAAGRITGGTIHVTPPGASRAIPLTP